MEAAMAKKSDVVGLRLRMPAGVHRLLAASAKRNNRSLNSEILWGLAQYLGGDAQKHVEHMAAHQRETIHNVLRALASNPEAAAKMIAGFDKRTEEG
jgi:hypothetical protein